MRRLFFRSQPIFVSFLHLKPHFLILWIHSLRGIASSVFNSTKGVLHSEGIKPIARLLG